MRLKLILIFALLSTALSGQLQVKQSNNTDFTPSDLINKIFLGEGVEITNIQYDGLDKSVGYFSNGISALAIDRGIIMSTGECTMATLANSPIIVSRTTSGSTYSDNDLETLIGTKEIYDISRYYITFVPKYDSVEFKYVFASEEYPIYSCNQYNDVFGFFISGPNPAGGVYTNQNIALIPNSNQIVSINNIHPDYPPDDCLAKNLEFYNVNPPTSDKFCFNGYLDQFYAKASVIPCTQYTIKLVIADVADQLYDSAVFLEAKSFSSNGLKVEISTPGIDNSISEGCDPAHIRFYFDQPVKQDYNLELRILNSISTGNIALSGQDYTPLPGSVQILKGQKDFSFSISALEDNIIENTEYIALEYRKDQCNLDTIILAIKDNLLPNLILEDTISVCEGLTKNVSAHLPGNVIPTDDKKFSSNQIIEIPSEINSIVYSEIPVTGIVPLIFDIKMLKEVCIDKLNSRNLADLDIYLVSPDDTYIELSTDNGFRLNQSGVLDAMVNTCFTPDATIPVNYGNPVLGNIDITNPNYTGNFLPEGVLSDLNGKSVNGKWKLVILNDEGNWTHSLEGWHLTFNADYNLFYKWSPVQEISCINCLSPDISPSTDKYFKINYFDNYGCKSNDSIYAKLEKKQSVYDLRCDSINVNFIRFKWFSLYSNSKYQYRLNNSPDWIDIDKEYIDITGLSFSTSVSIEVRIKSNECVNPSSLASCTTYPCPPPEIKLTSKENLTCFGENTGKIQLNAVGQYGPYKYRLNGISNNDGLFTGLSAGIYTVYISGTDNCEIPYIFTIESPLELTVNSSVSDISCFGLKDGFIDLGVNGGNGNYKFSWKNDLGALVSVNEDIAGLSKGKYFLTITDSKNCQVFKNFDIKEPTQYIASDSIVDNKCKGQKNGQISLDDSGGTAPYQYYWTTPDGISTDKNLLNLSSGIYKLKVTDSNGCIYTNQYVIHEPLTGLEYSLLLKDTLCPGSKNGTIQLVIAPQNNYIIKWENGSNAMNRDNLSSGLYSVSITDMHNCTEVRDIEIVELDTLKIKLAQSPPSCYNTLDGSAWVEKVFYGKRETNKNKFDYKWNNPGLDTTLFVYDLQGGKTYSLYAIDKYGCESNAEIYIEKPKEIKIKTVDINNVTCYGNSDGFIQISALDCNDCSIIWSTGHSSNSVLLDSLKSGIYKVTVTNAKGCKEEKQFEIIQPDPLLVSFAKFDVSCFQGHDGHIITNVSGGSEPYLVTWEDGSLQNNLDNLKTGLYKAKVSDLNGCEVTDSVFIGQPSSAVDFTLESIEVSCYGQSDGRIDIEASGGTPPYSYKVDGGQFYGINSIIGLKSGYYNAIVKDVNNCLDTLKNVFVDQPVEVIVDIGSDTIVGYNQKFIVNPKISFGTAPYTFAWHLADGVNISCLNCNLPEISTSFNTVVSLTVQDANGCVGQGTLNVFVKDDKEIYVPTAFHPESNVPENKRLYIYGKKGIQILDFKIFDDWGGVIYQRQNFMTNDESEGWDGTFKGSTMNSSSYPWVMNVKYKDGTTKIMKGFVTLLN